MIGQTQLYIILIIAVLLFGKSFIIKGVKDFFSVKREVKEAIEKENEDTKDKKVITS
jgi:Sec-independent protein translocase protein TatA